MSNQDEYDETDQADEPTGRIPQSLRDAAAAGKEAMNENARLKRELMFMKAGIDPEGNRAAQLLFKTFEGDDIAALQSEAKELGIKLPGSPTEEANAADRGQQSIRETLTGGMPAGGGGMISTDPITGAYEQFHADMKQGRPREDAAHKALDTIFRAAAEKDPRVLFNADEWYGGAVSSDPRVNA